MPLQHGVGLLVGIALESHIFVDEELEICHMGV